MLMIEKRPPSSGTRLSVPFLTSTLRFVSLTAIATSIAQAQDITQSATVFDSDGTAGSQFGYSLSVSGNYAIVGIPRSSTGAAHIYEKQGDTWQQLAILTSTDGAAGDNFGFNVAIDGNTAVVGAPIDDDNGPSSGSAYIFKRVNEELSLIHI